jgi:hypothetical protein
MRAEVSKEINAPASGIGIRLSEKVLTSWHKDLKSQFLDPSSIDAQNYDGSGREIFPEKVIHNLFTILDTLASGKMRRILMVKA